MATLFDLTTDERLRMFQVAWSAVRDRLDPGSREVMQEELLQAAEAILGRRAEVRQLAEPREYLIGEHGPERIL
jgi:hypothetical protein